MVEPELDIIPSVWLLLEAGAFASNRRGGAVVGQGVRIGGGVGVLAAEAKEAACCNAGRAADAPACRMGMAAVGKAAVRDMIGGGAAGDQQAVGELLLCEVGEELGSAGVERQLCRLAGATTVASWRAEGGAANLRSLSRHACPLKACVTGLRRLAAGDEELDGMLCWLVRRLTPAKSMEVHSGE